MDDDSKQIETRWTAVFIIRSDVHVHITLDNDQSSILSLTEHPSNQLISPLDEKAPSVGQNMVGVPSSSGR